MVSSIPLDGFQFHMGLGMGIGVGILQYLILRKHYAISLPWVWYSAIGMGAGFFIFDLTQLAFHLSQNIYLLGSVLLGSLIAGLVQSHVLHKNQLGRRYWVVLNSLGWLFSLGALKLIDVFGPLLYGKWLQFSINLSLILLGGPILGMLTYFGIRKLKTSIQ